MSEKRRRSRAVEVVGTAAGATAGALLGGPVGGIIGAAITPGTIEMVGRAWDEIVGVQQANAAAVVQLAAESAGIDVESFVQQILEDPAEVALFKNAVRAGANAIGQEKIRALSVCLANGFDDGSRVDIELVVVRALAQLDPVHVRVLAMIHSRGNANLGEVREFMGGILKTEDVSRPVLSVLEREGLVVAEQEDRSALHSFLVRLRYIEVLRAWDSIRELDDYKVTRFGLQCLMRLGVVPGRARPGGTPQPAED